MQVKTLVPVGPPVDLGVLVGAVVIQDQRDLQALGHLVVDRVEKLQELGMTVMRQALTDHRAGQYVKCREQRGRPVALVVMGHRSGSTGDHWHRRLGTVESLNLALVIHAQHDRLVRRVEVQTDDIDKLVSFTG